jgi:DNA-binding NarL/FixJ family response regulator
VGRRPAVAIVAPVRVYRESLADALREHGDVTVLGVAATAQEALRQTDSGVGSGVGAGEPDVLLVDAGTLCDVRSASDLALVCPVAPLVALAAPEDDEGIVACAAAGAAGFVAREAALEDVVTTIRAVARGDVACPPRVTAALLRRIGAAGEQPRTGAARTGLTSRERQILGLIDDGLSNKEISRRLYIEVSTVKNHVHNILTKLGAQRRSQAAARARPSGGS